MVSQPPSDANLAKNLPNYMKCLNNEKRKELGWQFPFEVYFSRKSNELVRCGLPENRGSSEIGKVSKPTKNDFNRFKKLRLKTRKRVLESNERVAKRTVKYFRKRNKCSVYKINQKVLVRYGKKGKKEPKRRHVFVGKIEKVGKNDMYKVGFRNLACNQNVSSSFSVEDIAGLQVQRVSNNKNTEKKFHKRLKEMVKQPEDQFDEQGYYISVDPLCYGNFQFSSICRVLRELVFNALQKH